MRTHAQGLLNERPAVAACLCGEARIDSDHLMSSTCSLGFKESEKCAPTGVHDGFREMMVLDHMTDSQVFDTDTMIVLAILPGYLKVEVTTLASNLEMGFRGVLSRLAAAVTAYLTTGKRTLLASERLGRRAIVARVLNRLAKGVREERFQANVNADIGMLTGRGNMFSRWLGFTHKQSIPVSIRTQDQVGCLGCPFYWAVLFDLERTA
jgi:hypothetical protein